MKTICVRLTKQFDHRVRVLAAEQDMTRSETGPSSVTGESGTA